MKMAFLPKKCTNDRPGHWVKRKDCYHNGLVFPVLLLGYKIYRCCFCNKLCLK